MSASLILTNPSIDEPSNMILFSNALPKLPTEFQHFLSFLTYQ